MSGFPYSQPMLLIKTRVLPSAIHGMGLFAVQFVPRGAPVWQFHTGFDHEFSPDEFAKFPAPARRHIRWFSFVSKESGNFILSGDHACFMNHSPSPSTGAAAEAPSPVTTVALQDITEGEGITCNYFEFDLDAAGKLEPAPMA